jgi:hypothetical protein
MSYAVEAVSGTGEQDFAAAVAQARAHYVEMPGLTLTVGQAARLWAIDMSLCREVLATLVETRFLIRTRDVFFARA